MQKEEPGDNPEMMLRKEHLREMDSVNVEYRTQLERVRAEYAEVEKMRMRQAVEAEGAGQKGTSNWEEHLIQVDLVNDKYRRRLEEVVNAKYQKHLDQLRAEYAEVEAMRIGQALEAQWGEGMSEPNSESPTTASAIAESRIHTEDSPQPKVPEALWQEELLNAQAAAAAAAAATTASVSEGMVEHEQATPIEMQQSTHAELQAVQIELHAVQIELQRVHEELAEARDGWQKAEEEAEELRVEMDTMVATQRSNMDDFRLAAMAHFEQQLQVQAQTWGAERIVTVARRLREWRTLTALEVWHSKVVSSEKGLY